MTKRRREVIREIELIKLKTLDGYTYTTNKMIKIAKTDWFLIEQPEREEKADTVLLKSDKWGESQVILFLHKPSGTYSICFIHYLLIDTPFVQKLEPVEFKNREDALIKCFNYARLRHPIIREKRILGKKLLNYKKHLFRIQQNKY